MTCDAAVRFYTTHARRARMVLLEAVMKLESVTIFCNLHDGDQLRKLFAPLSVTLREYAGGFQTFPVF